MHYIPADDHSRPSRGRKSPQIDFNVGDGFGDTFGREPFDFHIISRLQYAAEAQQEDEAKYQAVHHDPDFTQIHYPILCSFLGY